MEHRGLNAWISSARNRRKIVVILARGVRSGQYPARDAGANIEDNTLDQRLIHDDCAVLLSVAPNEVAQKMNKSL